MFKMFQYTHPKIVLFRIFVTGLGDFSFVFAHVDIYLVASIPFIVQRRRKAEQIGPKVSTFDRQLLFDSCVCMAFLWTDVNKMVLKSQQALYTRDSCITICLMTRLLYDYAIREYCIVKMRKVQT